MSTGFLIIFVKEVQNSKILQMAKSKNKTNQCQNVGHRHVYLYIKSHLRSKVTISYAFMKPFGLVQVVFSEHRSSAGAYAGGCEGVCPPQKKQFEKSRKKKGKK